MGLIFLGGGTFAWGQNAVPSPFNVGYRNLFLTDSSRIYKSGTRVADKMHYRPLEIDVWYPAVSSGPGPGIEYGELLQLLEDRSNRFQNDTVYRNMTKELVQALCAGLNIADTSQLIHHKTNSYRNAVPLPQTFPLIIYMCSFNGMGYENLHLFENLAGNGYIVAAVTSVGRYPGNMSTNPDDLLEQVRDGLFTLDRLKKMENVDPGKIGLIGYSWGGLAALLLSMNSGQAAAMLSLDGSEMHYYGESTLEDSDFDRLRNSPFFNTGRMHSPYTYLESGDKQSQRQVDSIFNIFAFLSVQKQYIRFPGTEHEDFSSLPSLAAQIAAKKSDSREHLSRFDKFSLYYFDAHLKDRPKALSTWLAETRIGNHADSVYPMLSTLKSALVIRGRVLDTKDKAPLAYVNIGIPGKNVGTVTRQDGSFALIIDNGMGQDSIRLSMAGFEGKSVKIDRLLKEQRPVTLLLEEKIAELKAAVVTSKAPRTKRLGNTTTSMSLSVGFPMRFTGAELGIRIKLGRRPVRLKGFNFNISSSRLDSAVFRLNIYGLDKGIPFGNKLDQNILVPVGKTVGAYMMDLSQYNLIMNGDILVSLELIEGSSSGSGPGVLFLSAGFLNSATWRRPASQGKWKKAAGIGVGFNVVVQE